MNKYDLFLQELKQLLDKHGLSLICHYDEIKVINKDASSDEYLDTLFDDMTDYR